MHLIILWLPDGAETIYKEHWWHPLICEGRRGQFSTRKRQSNATIAIRTISWKLTLLTSSTPATTLGG
jgi:hypothetical protein